MIPAAFNSVIMPNTMAELPATFSLRNAKTTHTCVLILTHRGSGAEVISDVSETLHLLSKPDDDLTRAELIT